MTGYDVVVIGAGAAGLSAGALLATEGKRVLVADRHHPRHARLRAGRPG
jgi:phytoene dehydrogenase-like protein